MRVEQSGAKQRQGPLGSWRRRRPETSTMTLLSATTLVLGACDSARENIGFEIGDDYVLGVWSGDQGVEYVRMYKLVK